MHFQIETSWDRALSQEYQKPYFKELGYFISQERQRGKSIFPPKHLVFNALQRTPYDKVKVVILGQDPYHGLGQAHGLSFSVPMGVRPPPSLLNIFKELVTDVGIKMPQHGCLEKWSEQGVLLLNTLLTVQEGQPLSHQKKGWEQFTDAVIAAVANQQDPVIFLLWGRNAKDKALSVRELACGSKHIILTAAHPSPLSAHNGFLGCRHFSKTNQHLLALGKSPIDWQV